MTISILCHPLDDFSFSVRFFFQLELVFNIQYHYNSICSFIKYCLSRFEHKSVIKSNRFLIPSLSRLLVSFSSQHQQVSTDTFLFSQKRRQQRKQWKWVFRKQTLFFFKWKWFLRQTKLNHFKLKSVDFIVLMALISSHQIFVVVQPYAKSCFWVFPIVIEFCACG